MTTVTEGETVKLQFIGGFKVPRFADIIKGLEELLQEGIFRLDREGLHLSQLNSERTCHVSLDISADWVWRSVISNLSSREGKWKRSETP